MAATRLTKPPEPARVLRAYEVEEPPAVRRVSDPTPAGTAENGDGFLLYPPTADGQLVTSIRWELLREGAEDFEYLLLTNNGKVPKTPTTLSICDLTVESAVSPCARSNLVPRSPNARRGSTGGRRATRLRRLEL